MTERSLGQVASVRIDNPWALGPEYYGLVLTDRRSIFVHTFTDKSALGGAVGGAIGAVLAGAAQAKPRDAFEYAALDLDTLAAEKKSIVVEHATVSEWELRKQALGTVYTLVIEYVEDGKTRKVKAMITEAAGVGAGPARSGAERKERGLQNARAVEAAYRQVLAPGLAARFHGVG